MLDEEYASEFVDDESPIIYHVTHPIVYENIIPTELRSDYAVPQSYRPSPRQNYRQGGDSTSNTYLQQYGGSRVQSRNQGATQSNTQSTVYGDINGKN